MAESEPITFNYSDIDRFHDRLLELSRSGDFEGRRLPETMASIKMLGRFLQNDPDFYFEVWSPEAYGERPSSE